MAEVIVGGGDRIVLRTGPTGQVQIDFAVEIVPEAPPSPPAPALPFEDIVASIPVNPHAPNPPATPGRWAFRTPAEIRGITVHHTGTHDYLALARYCTGPKGLPTTQYTYFVTANGEVLKCVDDAVAFWHDHGGYRNFRISIGLAGWLHKTPPPPAQITGLARICAYLLDKYQLPMSSIVGHRDVALPARVNTECPGWYAPPVGCGWKPDFDVALTAATANV